MKTPENASRLNQIWTQPVRSQRPIAMILAVAMAAFAPMNFAAQASETAGDAQASASADSSPAPGKSGLAARAAAAPRRLAGYDRRSRGGAR